MSELVENDYHKLKDMVVYGLGVGALIVGWTIAIFVVSMEKRRK